VNSKEIKKVIKEARKLANPFLVTDGSFRLTDIDPGDTLGLPEDNRAPRKPSQWEILAELQEISVR
jgi:hypothetical protein